MRETGSVRYTQLPTHTAANTAVVVRTSPFRRFLLTHFGHFRIEFFLQFSIAGNLFIKSRLQGRQFGLTFGNGRWSLSLSRIVGKESVMGLQSTKRNRTNDVDVGQTLLRGCEERRKSHPIIVCAIQENTLGIVMIALNV